MAGDGWGKDSQCWVYPVAPLSYKCPKYWPFMAQIWSSHGPSNWFFLNLNQCAQGFSMPNLTLLGLSCSPLSLKRPKYGPLWSKHGPHLVLEFFSSWILVIVTRDVSCQSSHCLVYPVAPFPRNSQNMALYGQNMVLAWSLKLVLPESWSMCPGIFHAKFDIAGCIL